MGHNRPMRKIPRASLPPIQSNQLIMQVIVWVWIIRGKFSYAFCVQSFLNYVKHIFRRSRTRTDNKAAKIMQTIYRKASKCGLQGSSILNTTDWLPYVYHLAPLVYRDLWTLSWHTNKSNKLIHKIPYLNKFSVWSKVWYFAVEHTQQNYNYII